MRKILIGCEESGIVREEFTRMGWEAWSCDLLPTRIPGNHIQADILSVLNDGWDAAIFFTPCTYLCNSGSRHLYLNGKKENGIDPARWENMRRDAELFKVCMNAPIPFIANENPVPHKYALEIIGRKYDQKIHPWQFGHGEIKGTCFWLKGFPKLVPTDVVEGRNPRIANMSPHNPNRQRDRAVTYMGIAKSMAIQWTNYYERMK